MNRSSRITKASPWSAWLRRLSKSFSGYVIDQAAHYEAGNKTKDYLWNLIGWSSWGFMFPLLTVVTTQLCDIQEAGMFTFLFAVTNVLYYIGTYGVRTYQVSDTIQEHTFNDYHIQRVLMLVIMAMVGTVSIMVLTPRVVNLGFALLAYRICDAYGDVFEGRLQQADKLYLAGISLCIRTVVTTVVCIVLMVITRNITFAWIIASIASAATLVLITIPLAYLETPKSARFEVREIKNIFVLCFPLFVALFLYTLLDTYSRLALSWFGGTAEQLYFIAMYFPAHGIIMVGSMIYKPQIAQLAEVYNAGKHKEFMKSVRKTLIFIAVITIATFACMLSFGIWITSILYGIDFSGYTLLFMLMVLAGGFGSVIDYLYQIAVIKRIQSKLVKLYVQACIVALPVTLELVFMMWITGAVIATMISMIYLAGLLFHACVLPKRKDL